jgi:hypothetical protein
MADFLIGAHALTQGDHLLTAMVVSTGTTSRGCG